MYGAVPAAPGAPGAPPVGYIPLVPGMMPPPMPVPPLPANLPDGLLYFFVYLLQIFQIEHKAVL